MTDIIPSVFRALAVVYMAICPWAVGLLLLFQIWRLIRLMVDLGGGPGIPGRMYDQVDGYEMEVGWQWFELTEEDRKAMCNGVGSASWAESLRTALDSETGFKAPSAPHDVDYTVYRTSDERLLADRRFFRNCVRVILADAGGWGGILVSAVLRWSSLRKTMKRILLARALYRALRAGGLAAFNNASKTGFTPRSRKTVVATS